MRKMDVQTTVLLALITGRIDFVDGEDQKRNFDSEFSLVSLLIILLFCLGGVYLCLYFTCCHEYLCTVEENVGCFGDFRNQELKPNSEESGNVKSNYSLQFEEQRV